VAASDRFVVADLVILAAVLLVTAGLVAIARSEGSAAGHDLAHYGRLAALLGGAVALAQIGLETYGFRQSAEAFADAPEGANQVGAFWATNAVDHVNVALFGVWTLVFIGLAPLLLGAASLRQPPAARWIGVVGALGGLCCVVVGTLLLVVDETGDLDVPFLIGSLLVTVWILAAGVELLRRDKEQVVLPAT
jgi:hypothetical protein